MSLSTSHTSSMRERSALLDPFNIISVLVIAALVVVSIVAQSDAHFYAGGTQYERHMVWVLVGGVTFLLAAVIDLRIVERVAYAYFGLCIVLLIATLFAGTSVNNSTRWLRFGAINIQASEFVKLGVILALARYLQRRRERKPGETGAVQSGKYGLRELVAPMLIVLLPAPLVLLQPDLGTTLMAIFVAATMLAVEGIQRRAAIILTVFTLVLIPVAWSSGLVKDYQKDRVRLLAYDDWQKIDPETNVIHESRRTQAEQSMWAIGTGGLTGQGHRNANTQRMRVFPEVHTDFISAMVAEQFGFLGMMLLLFLFWWLVVWALRTSLDSRSRFCRLVAAGVAALFGWQVFVNIGMVTTILPVVGVPLPFLSYGGSAFMMLMASLGLVLNIARKRGRM